MCQLIIRNYRFGFIASILFSVIISAFFSSQALAHNALLDHKHCPDGGETGPFVAVSADCPGVEPEPEPDGDTGGDDDGGAVETGGDDGSDDGGAVDTDPANASTAPIAFTNPIAFNTVDGLLSRILVTIQSIIAILAILFIVIGAIIYITSGGNQQRTELAKNAIFAALIGLALALAAPSFLKEIYLAVGGSPTDEVNNARSLTEIALNITRFLLSIVGVLSIVMLVSGGIIYILSAGDQSRTDTAKRTIIYAIIGLVVALVSLVVVGQVVGVISGV